jgi:multiple sugar transport system permease protein/raffinose/stachyose/melibiose transport system permease protein
MLFFAVFIVYPLLANLYYSLTSYSLGGAEAKFVGLDNYARLLRDADFLTSLLNTLVYAVCSVFFLTLTGLLLAVGLNGTARLKRFTRTGMIVPYATSVAAASLIWLLLLDPGSGPVNKLLAALGSDTQPGWLFDPNLAMPTLIVLNIWKNAGYTMVIFLAGLQTVPPALYEAATVDGAGRFRKLINVTLPSIKPVTIFVLITGCIEAFKTFDQVKILTKGGPMLRTSTVVYQIYIRAFEDFQMGYAAAQSVVLLAVVFAVTLFNFKSETVKP